MECRDESRKDAGCSELRQSILLCLSCRTAAVAILLNNNWCLKGSFDKYDNMSEVIMMQLITIMSESESEYIMSYY